MPICCLLRANRKIAEIDADIFLADKDLVGNVFNDLPLFFLGKLRPTGVQISCFQKYSVGREELNPQEVDLPLKFRDLVVDLTDSFLQWPELGPVGLHVYLFVKVGTEDPVPILLGPFLFLLQRAEGTCPPKTVPLGIREH